MGFWVELNITVMIMHKYAYMLMFNSYLYPHQRNLHYTTLIHIIIQAQPHIIIMDHRCSDHACTARAMAHHCHLSINSLTLRVCVCVCTWEGGGLLIQKGLIIIL